MKNFVRILKLILAVIVIIPVIYLASFLFICPIVNDIKASMIKSRYTKMELPAQTEIIETVSFCGNTSGTGNHIEIWVGVLICSTLSDEEIEHFFQNYYTVWALSPESGESLKAHEVYRESYYDKFPYLKNGGEKAGCYIIADYHSAVTQNDIRGH